MKEEEDSTYAKLGRTGVFDRNANGEHSFLTPFAVPSWERRFAIDWDTIEVSALLSCLSLALNMREEPLNSASFDIYLVSESRLGLGVAGTSNRFKFLSVEPDSAQLTLQEAAEQLHEWLKKAVYPPKPWFDGSEARGFQMFDVPYRAHPREFYGTLVIEPKWFEVHK